MNEVVDTISFDKRDLYNKSKCGSLVLCCDRDTNRVSIRDEPNAPSGGQVSDLDIGTFLRGGPHNPQQQALFQRHMARQRTLGSTSPKPPSGCAHYKGGSARPSGDLNGWVLG